MLLFLLREYLLFRFVFLHDLSSFTRLRALQRLMTRRELKEIKTLAATADTLGMDPRDIIAAYSAGKIAVLKEFLDV